MMLAEAPLIRALLCGAVLAISVSGGVAGRWAGNLVLKGSPPFAIELSGDDGALVGMGNTRPDFFISLERITLAANILSFEMRVAAGPLAKFRGEVSGDRFSGEVLLPGMAEKARFELKKEGRPARLPDRLPGAARVDALSDEFDSDATLANWQNLAAAEGLPDRIASMDANKTNPGMLRILPNSGAWWGGYHGIFLWKEVKGDFVITTRVKVSGRSGGEPEQIWTISGLLVRAQADAKAAMADRKENWIYVMTGRGPGSERVIDAKSTMDSVNVWDIVPAEAAWYELRIVRLGPLFVEFCRPDGGQWMVRKRILRPDLPETVQAGINVTSDFKLSATMKAAEYNTRLYPGKSAPDSVTLFDYVRFSAPGAGELAGREVVGITDAELLSIAR